MGHECWVLSQGLDSTETFGEGKPLEASEEGVSVLNAALDVEGDHGSWSSHLLLGNVVLWVALKSWVDDLCDLVVCFECLGNGDGIALGLVNSDLECLQRSEGKPAVEGSQSSAGALKNEEELVVEGSVVHNKASTEHVGVSTDVFGHRVGDDVGAEEERVCVYSCCKCVVDNKERVFINLFDCVSNCLNVETLQSWVGWSLEPDEPGVGLDHGLELVDVREVVEINFNAGVWSKDHSEVSLGSTVDIIDAEDVVTFLAKVHDGCAGCDSRSTGESKLAVFHGSKLSLERESSWVSAASVVEDNWLTWSRLSISGREVKWVADSTELCTWLTSDMDEFSASSSVLVWLVQLEVIWHVLEHLDGLGVSLLPVLDRGLRLLWGGDCLLRTLLVEQEG